MNTIVIDGAAVLDGGHFRTGTVRTRDGLIDAVAWNDDERAALCASASEVVDGSGHRLIPGLVNAHTHAYGTLLRGTESALPLELWAFYTIAYGYGLDDDDVAAGMLLHDAECIRSGITGVVDHFPHMAHAHAALDAHERSGMRVLFAAFVQDVSDYDLLAMDVPPELRDLADVPPVDIEPYEALFASLVERARGLSGRVQVALGPNAPQRCSPAIWSLWRRLRERHGVAVHAHALETYAQARISQQRWPDGGMIAAMDEAGLLTEGLSLAHAVWTTPAERALLAERGVAVSHNPLSNLTIGSGVMPLPAYIDAGVVAGIGTDGSNCAGRHDLFETMRAAMTLPRISERDPARWPDAARAMEMATTSGMQIIGAPGTATGIAPGAAADLVLMRAGGTNDVVPLDTLDAFVAQAGREAVASVMIDGRWVLRDGAIVAFDEARMLAAVADTHAAIAERVNAVTPTIDRALGAVAEQFRAWQQPA